MSISLFDALFEAPPASIGIFPVGVFPVTFKLISSVA